MKSFRIKLLQIFELEILVLIIVDPTNIFQILYKGKWLGNLIKSKSSKAIIQNGFYLLSEFSCQVYQKSLKLLTLS